MNHTETRAAAKVAGLTLMEVLRSGVHAADAYRAVAELLADGVGDTLAIKTEANGFHGLISQVYIIACGGLTGSAVTALGPVFKEATERLAIMATNSDPPKEEVQ